jgi:hypothetical protein
MRAAQSIYTAFLAALLCGALAGCSRVFVAIPPPEEDPSLDAMMIYEWLEARILTGVEKPGDRAAALHRIEGRAEDTAAYHYARAAVTGRYVEEQRLRAIQRVKEVESHARRSRELDPDFRGGAATRLLGTLYVLAPASALEHGDSETGIELLEALVQERPDAAENHLRLAEAYLALGDPASARPHICRWVGERQELAADERHLLDQLLSEATVGGCPPEA